MWDRAHSQPAPEDVRKTGLAPFECHHRVLGRRRVGSHGPSRVERALFDPYLLKELPTTLRVAEQTSEDIVGTGVPSFACTSDVLETSYRRKINTRMSFGAAHRQAQRAEMMRRPPRHCC